MSNSILTDGKPWAKQIIDLYTDGASDAEVAASLKVTIKEYYRQLAENAVFRQLVEFGRTLSQAYWEKLARQNVTNKQFNTPLWTFYMKNKFAWADKSEVTSSNENLNTNLDDLREQVNKEVARFIKDNTPELTDAKRVFLDIGRETGNA